MAVITESNKHFPAIQLLLQTPFCPYAVNRLYRAVFQKLSIALSEYSFKS
jgi:hypothetical protein